MIEFEAFLRQLKQAVDQADYQRISELLKSERSTTPEIGEFIREVLSAHQMRVRLLRDNSLLKECLLGADGLADRVSGITPSRYSLESQTGQLLWEADLEERHLLWSDAFPQEPLPLAASSDDLQETFSLSETFLDGSLRLHVSPGLTEGEIILRNCRFVG